MVTGTRPLTSRSCALVDTDARGSELELLIPLSQIIRRAYFGVGI